MPDNVETVPSGTATASHDVGDRRAKPRLTGFLADAPSSTGTRLEEAVPACDRAIRLLLASGQTTGHTIDLVSKMARRFDSEVSIQPGWGEATLRLKAGDETYLDFIDFTPPVNVDMAKVVAATGAIEEFYDGRLSGSGVLERLKTAAQAKPVSAARFVVMCAAGAAALSVINGADRPAIPVVAALVAGLGAVLRRLLGRLSANAYLQPLAAASLAGLAGATCSRLGLGQGAALVELCPCMVLLPGPHLLGGCLDLVQLRLPLGAMRVLHTALVSIAICTGLIIGLSIGGVALEPNVPVDGTVPLLLDVVSAGVAVAAYGSFYNIPWKLIPPSMVIGMVAHAMHWFLLNCEGSGAVVATFVACLVVGSAMTPASDRLRLPFAGSAFSAIVSMIPGLYMFRMAGGLVTLVERGGHAAPDTVSAMIADGSTAILVSLAIGLGLIIPALCFVRRTGTRR